MLVPPGVVTVTSTVPADPAGTVAVSWESESTVKPAAGAGPNDTADAPVNPLPLTVTVVPPATGPDGGEMPLTAGTGPPWSASALGADNGSVTTSGSAAARPTNARNNSVDLNERPH